MIEFFGELSEQNKKILAKNMRKKRILFGLFAFVFTVFPSILIISMKFLHNIGTILGIVGCSIGTLTLILSLLPMSKKLIEQFTPLKVIIDSDDLICMVDSITVKKKISDIERVEDHGDYYLIKLSIGKTVEFPPLCQKNLITQGTIEEFEEKFADKIVRNINISQK